MKLFCIALLSILASPVWSASNNLFRWQADIERLAVDPYWLALLHKPSVKSNSEIIDPGFFLSGSDDSRAELTATLAALLAPVAADENEHAQCRFIARSHWLQQQLPQLSILLPKVQCDLFNRWSDHQQIESVSAIFASGYLGNPASFYGHILLKFNSSAEKRALLQQQNINFGAAVPDNQNPLIYIVKGLAGGYNAVFSYGDFYRNTQTYGENELRDLWEYKLALTPAEMQQLLFHAWELIGRDYIYYFLKENCAYRMAELLELVIQQRLISKRQPYAMPISVFHRLAEIKHHGRPLVAEIIQHPSRQKRLVAGYQQATDKMQQAVAAIIVNNYILDLEEFQSLNTSEQSQVLEILFDYLEFLNISDDSVQRTQQKNQLLRARLRLPPGPQTRLAFNDAAPHLSTYPSLLQVSWIETEQKPALEVRFRATYYDLLTANRDKAMFSALSMFDLHLRQQNNSLQLYRFELLNIENMNLSQTGLPEDGGLAWKVNFGYAAENLACWRCQTVQFTGGIGKAWQVNNAMFYVMQDGRLHQNQQYSGVLSTDSRLGTVFELDTVWRIQLEFGYRAYLGSAAENFVWYRLQQRFGNSQRWDLRVAVERQRSTEGRLAVSYYW
ncbi:hypothetical protein GCM10010919_02380 [Alishewanella longhuensis]|uniref:DUF4105 domain-containing protein n=1 Tax=Alishewanella longhuensis TaxID=1091037 RepID=A0ABQ3KW51_9ALTE|nr:DUF4105 domain-containing protein [Alishewanella longhuensis]GHG59650.1 hypothetical protein GCM10010919_02380 [Alishewanella longhuensis]